MQETQKQTIALNGKEYNQDELTQDQINMVNHLIDIDNQLGSLEFKAQQLQVCKQSFLIQLEASLKQSELIKNKTKEEDKKEAITFLFNHSWSRKNKTSQRWIEIFGLTDDYLPPIKEKLVSISPKRKGQSTFEFAGWWLERTSIDRTA